MQLVGRDHVRLVKNAHSVNQQTRTKAKGNPFTHYEKTVAIRKTFAYLTDQETRNVFCAKKKGRQISAKDDENPFHRLHHYC